MFFVYDHLENTIHNFTENGRKWIFFFSFHVWKILLNSFLLSESFQCSDHISLVDISVAIRLESAVVVDVCLAVVEVLIRIWRCLTPSSDFCVAICSECTVSIEWRVVRWTLSEAAPARSALSSALYVDLEWFSEAGSNQEEDDGWWRKYWHLCIVGRVWLEWLSSGGQTGFIPRQAKPTVFLGWSRWDRKTQCKLNRF